MFNIHKEPLDENGEWNYEKAQEYCAALQDAFLESPEGQACDVYYEQLGWTSTFLGYGVEYQESLPPEMSLLNVEEIIFDIIPRKVVTEPETADEIIGELRAFWEFLGRQYHLPLAPQVVRRLGRDAVLQLKSELSNSNNFGMAKSIFMQGVRAGFDLSTKQGLQTFMAAFNSGMLDNSDAPRNEPLQAAAKYPPVSPPRTKDELRKRDKRRQKLQERLHRRRP